MSELVRKQAGILAQKRADKIQLLGELKRAQDALNDIPEYLRVAEIQKGLSTLKSEDAMSLTALREAMLTADANNEELPDCGKVINKTTVEIVDADAFKLWVIEKGHLSLLTPVKAEVNKVAPTLNPDGVEITTAKHARVSSNLDAFLISNGE